MRLEITRRSDLATRALLQLDRIGRRAKASEVADRVGTTPGFLSQAMTPLDGRGWVRSEPGPTGGYVLAAGLDALTVLDVIEEEGLCDRAARLGARLKQRLASLQDQVPELVEIRGPGFCSGEG